MLAVSGPAVGAVLGLLVGIAMSIYVGMLDYRKRRRGVRNRAEYRLSLFGVPLILAAIGAGVGAVVAH